MWFVWPLYVHIYEKAQNSVNILNSKIMIIVYLCIRHDWAHIIERLFTRSVYTKYYKVGKFQSQLFFCRGCCYCCFDFPSFEQWVKSFCFSHITDISCIFFSLDIFSEYFKYLFINDDDNKNKATFEWMKSYGNGADW